MLLTRSWLGTGVQALAGKGKCGKKIHSASTVYYIGWGHIMIARLKSAPSIPIALIRFNNPVNASNGQWTVPAVDLLAIIMFIN